MRSYRAIAVVLSTALLMQHLDSTILTTALPTIARQFRVPPLDLNVTLIAYQLSMAIFIPLGAGLADRFGSRTVFVFALTIFMLGSILCGLSDTLQTLVAARAVQGVGGAIMLPVARLVVVQSAEKHELISALNWLLVPAIIGPLLGPLIGGLIVSHYRWNWIFFVNVPVAFVGILLATLLVPNRKADCNERFDIVGMALIAPASGGIIFGLEGLGRAGQGAASTASLAGGVGMLLVYGLYARDRRAPLVNVRLLDIATFRLSMVIGTLLRIAASAGGFMLALLFQVGMGLSPARAGSLMLMIPAGSLLGRFAAKILLKKLPVRRVVITSCAAYAAMLVLLSTSLRGWPSWSYMPQLGILGLLMMVPLLILNALAYVDVPAEQTSAAAGFYTMVQQLAMSAGIAAAVWIITTVMRIGNFSQSQGATYYSSIQVLAVVATLAGLLSMSLHETAGQELR
jgi:EmrB/QacA subfamily drug resistance transporter